jgi:hypothetical protein
MCTNSDLIAELPLPNSVLSDIEVSDLHPTPQMGLVSHIIPETELAFRPR